MQDADERTDRERLASLLQTFDAPLTPAILAGLILASNAPESNTSGSVPQRASRGDAAPFAEFERNRPAEAETLGDENSSQSRPRR